MDLKCNCGSENLAWKHSRKELYYSMDSEMLCGIIKGEYSVNEVNCMQVVCRDCGKVVIK